MTFNVDSSSLESLAFGYCCTKIVLSFSTVFIFCLCTSLSHRKASLLFFVPLYETVLSRAIKLLRKTRNKGKLPPFNLFCKNFFFPLRFSIELLFLLSNDALRSYLFSIFIERDLRYMQRSFIASFRHLQTH